MIQTNEETNKLTNPGGNQIRSNLSSSWYYYDTNKIKWKSNQVNKFWFSGQSKHPNNILIQNKTILIVNYGEKIKN